MATIKLNRNQTFDLIKIYKSYEFIWNQQHELYKRSDLKRKAWQDIANRFKCSDDDIKKKIRYLRSAYIYEKRKVEDCERGGGSYEPNLFYYKELDFLKPTITSRKVDYRDEGTCNGFDETETTDGIYCEEIDQKPFAEKFEELRKYMQLKDLTELTEPNKQKEHSVEPIDHREFEIDDNSNAQECPQRLYSNNTNSNKDHRLLSPLRRKAMSISSKSDEYDQSADMSVQNNNSNHINQKDDSTYVPPLKLRVLPSMITQNTSSHNANHVDVSSESNDIYYHTTKVWTDKLRHLTKTQRILAEKAINDIIFHGELDMLSIDKVQKISIHLNERT